MLPSQELRSTGADRCALTPTPDAENDADTLNPLWPYNALTELSVLAGAMRPPVTPRPFRPTPRDLSSAEDGLRSIYKLAR